VLALNQRVLIAKGIALGIQVAQMGICSVLVAVTRCSQRNHKGTSVAHALRVKPVCCELPIPIGVFHAQGGVKCGLINVGTVSQHGSLGSVRKALILGDAALKTASECSFTTRKLRFLGCFRLA
jgi:hypothetical protein